VSTNPFEAIKTNVLGAQNIIDAAIDRGVPQVLALSTDKAVNPVNLYGATKLCAEKLFVQGNALCRVAEHPLACVRYGNVVGSRGSVIPLFMEQKRFGQVTLTDEQMTGSGSRSARASSSSSTASARLRGGEVLRAADPEHEHGRPGHDAGPRLQGESHRHPPRREAHECLPRPTRPVSQNECSGWIHVHVPRTRRCGGPRPAESRHSWELLAGADAGDFHTCSRGPASCQVDHAHARDPRHEDLAAAHLAEQ